MKWTKRKAVLAGVGIGLLLLVVLLPLGGTIARQFVVEPAGGPFEGEADITRESPWDYFAFGWDGTPQVDIHITTMPK
jgi:hypothetical protein